MHRRLLTVVTQVSTKCHGNQAVTTSVRYKQRGITVQLDLEKHPGAPQHSKDHTSRRERTFQRGSNDAKCFALACSRTLPRSE